MARTQADDYNQKRMVILDAATELFAREGFHATSISDIANRCKTSKSRLYHYFSSKEQVLYEILHDHACSLRDSFLPIMEHTRLTPRQKLEDFAGQMLIKNVKFRAKHKLILGELDALPAEQRTEVATLLRKPIESIYEALAEVNPSLANNKSMQFPVAMMFFGMINWTHTWFSDEGELSPEHFAKLLSDTFIDGFASVRLNTGM